ncbi:aldehyde dehydrogenase family protein [Virgisporangium aurantiacum]|uniref:Gamma-glutamyl-phosphate reductase n=1 Tax=Virgisporangium aurantiacum TaxID=175570 RepID=A0A8J3ZIR6_9ACTN|nr:aldehyde dehydrogenase family protein [Virgisporangium aurantiacum]GIJ62715.1 gamma-glutamyl-phosphate reductase [Virgisporangium aurantiacum]
MTLDAAQAVADAAARAAAASPALAAAGQEQIDAAIVAMAERLSDAGIAAQVLAANEVDCATAKEAGMAGGLLDRLRLTPARLTDMAGQLRQLADTEALPTRAPVRPLESEDGGLVVEEWRRPVGVIGANFEARPNVAVDVASQLVKSRNAGVLRTGSAAIGSAAALVDLVVGPALAAAGLPGDAVQLLRVPGRESAEALVTEPTKIPLVILRGSGESTRTLAARAALAGVKTLAHADGGGVIYLHPAADKALAEKLIGDGLDRLGVCNRLNLLLIDTAIWDETVPGIVEKLAAREPKIAASLPPHQHPLGYEWALDDNNEATVTIAPADGELDAADIANRETSGLAATIVTEDATVANRFLKAYVGTGAFWNASTRRLDGFKLLGVPETGINVDRVPGPRGPVTFRDLYLRQYVVVPADRTLG